jgi:hypothetical protein
MFLLHTKTYKFSHFTVYRIRMPFKYTNPSIFAHIPWNAYFIQFTAWLNVVYIRALYSTHLRDAVWEETAHGSAKHSVIKTLLEFHGLN